MTITETRPTEPGTGKPELTHLVCCGGRTRTRTFCGVAFDPTRLQPEGADDPCTMCVVCAEMDDDPPTLCPEGGRCRFA